MSDLPIISTLKYHHDREATEVLPFAKEPKSLDFVSFAVPKGNLCLKQNLITQSCFFLKHAWVRAHLRGQADTPNDQTSDPFELLSLG